MDRNVVLLVEDNPDDEVLTLRALQSNDVPADVVVVRDGAEALDYLFGTGSYRDRDASVLPQVVLLDLKLPKLDGKDVLRRLRDHSDTRRLPVVVLTSSTEQEDLKTLYDLGANSYIRKPVDFRQFEDTIKQLGMYWLVLNEPPPTSGRIR